MGRVSEGMKGGRLRYPPPPCLPGLGRPYPAGAPAPAARPCRRGGELRITQNRFNKLERKRCFLLQRV